MKYQAGNNNAAAARAIIHEPTLILADEPTGNLDSKSAKSLMSALQDLHEQKRVTIAMVTHDPVAASYCERILFIRDGEIFQKFIKEERSKPFPRNSGRTCDARRRIS